EGSALLAGTWELPWIEAAGARSAAGGLRERYGGVWKLSSRLARVRHSITHRDLEVAVHRADLAAGDEVAEGLEAGWFDAGARDGLPLSSLVGKVLAAASR